MKKQKPQHKNVISLTLSIVVGFTIIMFFLILFLSQRSTNEEEDSVIPSKLSDKLVSFTTPQVTGKSIDIRKEGYISEIEKPFDEGNYEYEERTRDFRFVCTSPCPVSKSILDQEFVAISHAVSTLRGITQTDIKPEIMAFEVHASADSRCPKIDAPAYMSTFTDNNGYVRGKLCFRFDEVSYDRSNFPYSTSVHEVNHLFQMKRFPPYYGENRILTEGLSMILDSFFEKGSVRDSFCWEGNNWYSQRAHLTDSVHIKGASLFFELCNQYGFEYNNLPELFRQMDAEGKEVTVNGFVNIINNIVGADTSQIFRNAGINV